MEFNPQSDIEVLAYFCQNIWKTPFELKSVYSVNEVHLHYAGIDIDAYITYDADEITKLDLADSSLIICWKYWYPHDVPIIELSDENWSEQHFDTLLSKIHETFKDLEIKRLEFSKSRSDAKHTLFQLCLTMYDLAERGKQVNQQTMVNFYGWPKDMVSRAHSILLGLKIMSPNQIVSITDRNKVVKILDKYIDLQ